MIRFVLILGLISFASCQSGRDPQVSSKVVSREEIFAGLDEIGRLHRETTDVNRCEQETRIDQILMKNCSDCFDGWSAESYRVDKDALGCDPSAARSACFKEPLYIVRSVSNCVTCGIKYFAVPAGELHAETELEDLFESISCETFYDILSVKKNACGECLVKSVLH